MSLQTILIIALIVLVIASIPTYPYSRSWGYFPSGTIGVILLVLLILVVAGII